MNSKVVSCPGAALRRWRSWSLAWILAISPIGAPAGGTMDLRYRISLRPGEGALKQEAVPPIRVYDDGHRTYLVLPKKLVGRALKEIPKAVMATRDGNVQLAGLDFSTPDPSIAGVYDQIVVMIGRQEAIATYLGSRGQPADRERPGGGQMRVTGIGGQILIERIPEPEAPPRKEENGGIAGMEPAAAAAPEATPPPAIQPAPEKRPPTGQKSRRLPGKNQPVQAKSAPLPEKGEAVPEKGLALRPPDPPGLELKVLPSNQVAKVIATADDPLPVPAAGPESESQKTGEPPASDVAEYKVMVPFAMGKTVLGKEGEKAMAEVAQIGPIAKEIRIRAPVDPGNNLLRAHGRAAEIHKQLMKAGLVRQRISIETIDGVPDGNIVQAEVALIIDLAPKKGEKGLQRQKADRASGR